MADNFRPWPHVTMNPLFQGSHVPAYAGHWSYVQSESYLYRSLKFSVCPEAFEQAESSIGELPDTVGFGALFRLLTMCAAKSLLAADELQERLF